MTTSDKKISSNKILPSSPLFEMIMAPLAQKSVKELAQVKGSISVSGEQPDEEWINVVKELPGSDRGDYTDDNLAQVSLNIGTIGMIIGTLKENPTTCRFFVSTGDRNTDGVYHVNIACLKILKTIEDFVKPKK